MKDLVTKTVMLFSDNAEAKRQEILSYFEKTWAVDEKLYEQLASDENFYHRGDPLRHVLIFYLGHTAVFFINKLFLAKLIDARINPSFESIFAIGVDEMSWDDLDERHYSWPQVSEVRAYRDKAKTVITKIIKNTKLTLPIKWDDPFWIILMGIEHERIHLETSSVLLRQLPLNELVAGRFGSRCLEQGEAPQNIFRAVEAGNIKLGKTSEHPLYGWDNEYGSYTEHVAAFDATQFLISNAEFLKFVESKGYDAQKYWTAEGWNWRNYKQANMPFFWLKKIDGYWLRLVAEEIPMPWNWPVEVNYLEAKAYCNWLTETQGKTFRLPTEAEWYRLLAISKLPNETEWQMAPGNINLEHFTSPCPVDMFKQGDFYDVVGNVWQWTETPITGFAGFKVHPMYDDFSTPTFDGQHNIIKGGSWISTGNEATHEARYAFRRHFYQHAGFRVVASENALVIENHEYETDTEVANSCEDNWGAPFCTHENFSKQLATKILALTKDRKITRVLDLNADTGRLAFELAQYFDDITAIDFTARFIRMPIQLQQKGFIRYIIKDEGELVFYRDVVLSETGLEAGKDKILFMQDNANNLKSIYTGYDLIVLPNLLEELICPILFLKQIHERLSPQGILVIASTYDWESYEVKREHWPGGFKQDGEPVTSFEGIQQLLSEHFTLLEKPENVMITRWISTRKARAFNTEISCWQKK
ncbi:MAG: SAM-dependent methyltransferase [Porphyromonadaceae bacterium CG2_30_38_12]|nr:MAG: SAM-dependent methyltransferase [Porphyromonadaceae bacterium CG2_30_38_12]